MAGNYAAAYREYRDLIDRVWETNHQSCVLLLSHEQPSEMTSTDRVNVLQLQGIGAGGREIFRVKGLKDENCWDEAIEYLAGNPAYLESVADTVNKLCGGKMSEFCQYEQLFLTEEIKSILTDRLGRLSVVETEVIRLVAIENAPITIAQAIASLSNRSPAEIGIAIVSLSRRGMVERSEVNDSTVFGMLPIVRQLLRQIA